MTDPERARTLGDRLAFATRSGNDQRPADDALLGIGPSANLEQHDATPQRAHAPGFISWLLSRLQTSPNVGRNQLAVGNVIAARTGHDQRLADDPLLGIGPSANLEQHDATPQRGLGVGFLSSLLSRFQMIPRVVRGQSKSSKTTTPRSTFPQHVSSLSLSSKPGS